ASSRYACAVPSRAWKTANCRADRPADMGSAALAGATRSAATEPAAAVTIPALTPVSSRARRETGEELVEFSFGEFGIWPMWTSVNPLMTQVFSVAVGNRVPKWPEPDSAAD